MMSRHDPSSCELPEFGPPGPPGPAAPSKPDRLDCRVAPEWLPAQVGAAGGGVRANACSGGGRDGD
jgi:hypothetical protein